ncbi:MAG TPA: hypothetical protein VFW65_16595 [Pseudonocardiaceae bacterium]|nr:hypothetical protein [Pseudonocardiaceae bacterium]
MADSAQIDSIVTAVRSGTVVDHVAGHDPLVVALVAVADGEYARATRVLAKAEQTARTVTARADILALQGNWAGASLLYRRAVELDGADPVALLGRAVAAVSRHRATFAESEVRSLRDRFGDGPVLRHYLVLALVCRAGEVCAVSRDGRPVITSTAQLAECERIAAQLTGRPVDDTDLAAAAAGLTEQVSGSREWRWRRIGANTGILAGLLALSLVVALFTGLGHDPAMAIGSLVVGAGTLYLYVVTNRRPVWELRALGMAHMITAPTKSAVD